MLREGRGRARLHGRAHAPRRSRTRSSPTSARTSSDRPGRLDVFKGTHERVQEFGSLVAREARAAVLEPCSRGPLVHRYDDQENVELQLRRTPLPDRRGEVAMVEDPINRLLVV